jgi:hypothetical protein
MARLVNVSAVSHDGNNIVDAANVDWNERGQPVALPPGDNKTMNVGLILTNRAVDVTIGFLDDAAMKDADVLLGADGTLLATGDDSAGGTAVTLNVANCVIVTKGGRFQSQGGAAFTITGRAYSSDGTTNPVSYT